MGGLFERSLCPCCRLVAAAGNVAGGSRAGVAEQSGCWPDEEGSTLHREGGAIDWEILCRLKALERVASPFFHLKQLAVLVGES